MVAVAGCGFSGWAFRALQIPGVVPFGPPGRVEHLAARVHGRQCKVLSRLLSQHNAMRIVILNYRAAATAGTGLLLHRARHGDDGHIAPTVLKVGRPIRLPAGCRQVRRSQS